MTRTSFIGFLALALFATDAMAEGLGRRIHVRGMRVDPANIYEIFPTGTKIETIADTVAEDAKRMDVTILFTRAYHPLHGAYYQTDFQDVAIEPSLGRADFLNLLVTAAKKRGIAVVAWLPVNNFAAPWRAHPEWRAKKKDGTDYQPLPEVFPLSARVDSFVVWYRAFVKDLLQRCPQIAGVEAADAIVDYARDGSSDFNPEANRTYKTLFPGGTLGDDNWKRFRANGLTQLHDILFSQAHRRAKATFVTQNWPTKNDAEGSFVTSLEHANASGFDFDGILSLKPPGRPDYAVGELIWQQWRHAHKNPVFTPDWTRTAAKKFVELVGGRSIAMVHVQHAKFGTVVSSPKDFEKALRHAQSLAYGVDFYGYHEVKKAGVIEVVRAIYSDPAPRAP